MAITKAEREAMPKSWFAFPDTLQGPMPDENHARLAWDMIERTKGVSDDERKAARRRVIARAKELGVDTSGWNKPLSAMAFTVESLSAMALNLPEIADHPNRMPFSGVLTKLDQPSDKPVNGSLGKRVIIPREVAETALPSLLGMAVDYVPSLDGHDPKAKIGIITGATIDGDDLRIEGFLYASDFPEEAALIKAKKDVLGFSYETAQNFVESLEGEFLVLAACTFTGAAILRKDKAAYETTSLAASAADTGDFDTMTKEEIAALMAEAVAGAVAPLNAKITSLEATLAASEETRNKVEPHAKALEACADAMDAAAVGGHPQNGHAAVIRRMAGSMRAEGAVGKIPHIWRDHDYPMYASADGKGAAPAENAEVTELKAKMAKLEGDLAAARASSPEPQRKTLTPQITSLMAKANVTLGDDGKLSASAVDTGLRNAGLSIQERLRIKAAFAQAGLLPANAA